MRVGAGEDCLCAILDVPNADACVQSQVEDDVSIEYVWARRPMHDLQLALEILSLGWLGVVRFHEIYGVLLSGVQGLADHDVLKRSLLDELFYGLEHVNNRF